MTISRFLMFRVVLNAGWLLCYTVPSSLSMAQIIGNRYGGVPVVIVIRIVLQSHVYPSMSLIDALNGPFSFLAIIQIRSFGVRYHRYLHCIISSG